MAKRDASLTESHSVDEAAERHRAKARPLEPSLARAAAAPPEGPMPPSRA